MANFSFKAHDVFLIRGSGMVFRGMVESGVAQVGDHVSIDTRNGPTGARIKLIELNHKPVDRTQKGVELGILIDRFDEHRLDELMYDYYAENAHERLPPLQAAFGIDLPVFLAGTAPDPDDVLREESESDQRSLPVSLVTRLTARFPAWPWLSIPVLLAFSLMHGERGYEHAMVFFGFGLIALIGAVSLRFAARWTFKVEVPLRMAFEALLVSLAVMWGLTRAYADALHHSAALRLANVPFLILVNASVLALMIRPTKPPTLGFWRACVLTVLIVVGVIVVRLALGGFSGLLGWLASFHR